MKKSIFILLSSIFLLTACNEVHLTMKDSGKTIKASPGTLISIALVSNRSTGNSWRNIGYDHAVIKSAGDPEYKKNEKGLVGAPGEVVFTFKALNNGQTNLVMEYGSSHNTNKETLKKFRVKIVVE
ncbi:MAG: hypothetical protein DRJ09_01935 [Bacteroidetes bacterium]|nr:MAG: hypothetical protein DRJ09_01935 [Bacteroidota bacterium]